MADGVPCVCEQRHKKCLANKCGNLEMTAVTSQHPRILVLWRMASEGCRDLTSVQRGSLGAGMPGVGMDKKHLDRMLLVSLRD